MEETKVNMPLLGDAFPELKVQTTHGPMNIPGDMKGNWFVLFSHPGTSRLFALRSLWHFKKDTRI